MIKVDKIRIYILVLIFILTSVSNINATELNGQTNQLINSVSMQTTTQAGIDVEENIVQGNGFQVVFKVKDKWDKGYNAELVITNTQQIVLEDWGVKFDLNANIENIWGAEIESKEGQTYKLKNLGWNQDIAVGESITIGFTATYENYIKAPYNYQWLSKQIQARQEDYSVEFVVNSDWKEAFNGEIRITNNTQYIIRDWQLEFDYDREISQFWTAEIVEHVGEHYVIKNLGYNANIEPAQTISLGFAAAAGNVQNEPSDYKLTSWNGEEKEEINLAEIDNVIFADSKDDNAILIETGQTLIKGSIWSNGGIDFSTSSAIVTNYCQAGKEIYIQNKDNEIYKILKGCSPTEIPNLAEYSPFVIETQKECYVEDTCINDLNYTVQQDTIGLEGLKYSCNNMKLENSIMALESIEIIADELKSDTDSVVFIYSANGNIVIQAENIELNTIIYAPNGSVTILGDDVQVNGKIYGNKINIKGKKFTLTNRKINKDRNNIILDCQELQIGYYSPDSNLHVTQNLILPQFGSNGSEIKWQSSDPDIINSKGEVTQADTTTYVKLTAILSNGVESLTKDFEIKVIKKAVYNVINDNTESDLARMNNGEIPELLKDNDVETLRFISGKYTDLIIESPEEAIRSLYSVKSLMNIEDPEKEFVWKSTDDMFGDKAFRLQQVYKGIPVYGRSLVVCAYENGETSSLSGNYNPDVREAQVTIAPNI